MAKIRNKNNLYVCSIKDIANNWADFNSTLKELKNIHQIMKRLINNNDKYKNVHTIIGISNTDSHTAIAIKKYTNKKGRPKTEIIGRKIHCHLHIYIYNEDGSAAGYCNELKKHLVKKGYYIYSKPHNNIYKVIEYINKQCNRKYTYGKYFKSYFNMMRNHNLTF